MRHRTGQQSGISYPAASAMFSNLFCVHRNGRRRRDPDPILHLIISRIRAGRACAAASPPALFPTFVILRAEFIRKL
jgi:hypothetical protein